MQKSESLMDFISILPDPRVTGRVKHSLEEVVAMACCAVLSGAESWIDVVDWSTKNEKWLRKFLSLKNGIPSHDTFGRVFSILDAEALQKMFIEWVDSFSISSDGEKNKIHIDGKFINGSLIENNCRKSTMIISAWSSTLGIVLGVKESKLKKEEGEKRATEELLEKLYLKGAIITLDANGATPRITEKINERKGDYIIGLKDNQRQLKKLCIAVFDDISNKNKMETFKTIDKGHGRKETRRYDFLNLKKCSNGGMPTLKARIMDKWKSLGGFCKVTSTIERNGRTTTEVRYYFSSLKKNVKEIGDTIRAHWSVESVPQMHRTKNEEGGARINKICA